MPFNFGYGELLITLPLMLVVWGIPVAAAVWALRTAVALRRDQRVVLARLDSLEAELGRRS